MAVSYNKYNKWIGYLQGAIAANSVTWATSGGDAIKVALSNTAGDAVATVSQYTSITQISGTNGYTTGGASATITDRTWATATTSYPLTLGSPTWTSSTGNMGPFQYIIFYDNTPTDKPLICWFDYGSALTLNGVNGDTFTVSLTTANLFTVT